MSQVQAYCAHSVTRLWYAKVRTSPTVSHLFEHSHAHTHARTHARTHAHTRIETLRSHRARRAICLANIFSSRSFCNRLPSTLLTR